MDMDLERLITPPPIGEVERPLAESLVVEDPQTEQTKEGSFDWFTPLFSIAPSLSFLQPVPKGWDDFQALEQQESEVIAMALDPDLSAEDWNRFQQTVRATWSFRLWRSVLQTGWLFGLDMPSITFPRDAQGSINWTAMLSKWADAVRDAMDNWGPRSAVEFTQRFLTDAMGSITASWVQIDTEPIPQEPIDRTELYERGQVILSKLDPAAVADLVRTIDLVIDVIDGLILLLDIEWVSQIGSITVDLRNWDRIAGVWLVNRAREVIFDQLQRLERDMIGPVYQRVAKLRTLLNLVQALDRDLDLSPLKVALLEWERWVRRYNLFVDEMRRRVHLETQVGVKVQMKMGRLQELYRRRKALRILQQRLQAFRAGLTRSF